MELLNLLSDGESEHHRPKWRRRGRPIAQLIAGSLILTLLINSVALAGLDSKKAAYQGGTTKDKDFPGTTEPVEGKLDLSSESKLVFEYKLKNDKEKRAYSIPYDRIIDVEYGQKAGRRVGAAITTALLISPAMLFLLFSKKRKHYVTIGYKGETDKDEVAVFELGKDITRVTLAVVETRSGKKIEYQDDEARKSSKGN